MRLATLLATTALVATALTGACQRAVEAPPAANSGTVSLQVSELATGLEYPWGAALLPDGQLLVTERAGRLRVIRDGALVAEPVAGVPAVLDSGQGGLFDVALHPQFAENGLVYLALARGTERENRTAVVRGRFNGTALESVETVFEASPTKSGGAHFGGRLLFLPDGTLLVTLGDGFDWRDEAQNKASDFGKIVRITDTGAPAPGNPFAGEAGARAEIYTLGHRNVQGIARDPASGTIYAVEHGPKGGDEVNVLRPGANYGWPVITYGVDYSGLPISMRSEADGMEQPLVYWVPSIAPGGMAFYDGAMFPAWRGDLLVPALAGQHLRRVDLEGGTVQGQESLLAEREERYRQVIIAPDGALLLLTDAPEGKVLRVVAAP